MDDEEQESCPHCQMPIYDEDWLTCPFCGERLDVSAGFVSGLTKGPMRTVGIVIALVLLYCFLWLLL